MDRLLREGNPPVGQLASPKPQYKPGVDEYAPVEVSTERLLLRSKMLVVISCRRQPKLNWNRLEFYSTA